MAATRGGPPPRLAGEHWRFDWDWPASGSWRRRGNAPIGASYAYLRTVAAMYTAQALWTMAREGLKITTVIFANRAYSVLSVSFPTSASAIRGPVPEICSRSAIPTSTGCSWRKVWACQAGVLLRSRASRRLLKTGSTAMDRR